MRGEQQRSGKSATTGYIQPTDYSATSLIDAIRDALNDAGMGPPPELPEIGQVRCPGIGKPPSNRSGWINVKNDCAHIMDHSSGFTLTVFADKPRLQADVMAFQRKLARSEEMRQAKQDATHETTALTAASTCDEAIVAAPASGYLASKGLTCTHFARWHAGLNCWLIGLYDVYGKLWNCQRIYNDGNKRFMKGGRITSCFAPLGQLDINTRRILIAKGFATGASLREETGEVVACAMNGGNLKPVCEAIRGAYPDISIIVCGDNDSAAPVNVGRIKANDAVASVKGKVAFPTFCENCNGCTDFNDAIQCENKEAAR